MHDLLSGLNLPLLNILQNSIFGMMKTESSRFSVSFFKIFLLFSVLGHVHRWIESWRVLSNDCAYNPVSQSATRMQMVPSRQKPMSFPPWTFSLKVPIKHHLVKNYTFDHLVCVNALVCVRSPVCKHTVCACTRHSSSVKIRGQLAKVGFLLLP